VYGIKEKAMMMFVVPTQYISCVFSVIYVFNKKGVLSWFVHIEKTA